jgi:hypothetical protein
MATYATWVADGSPWVDARPVRAVGDILAAHGYTVYYHGDQRHLTHVPPEDHTPFSATGWPGSHPYPYCLATDIMPPAAGQKSKLTGRPLPGIDRLAAQLLADKQAGIPATRWLKYMNSTDAAGQVWHDAWQPDHTRTTSSDSGHIHLSGRTDFADSGIADGYDLVARTEGDDMVIYGWDASHYDAIPDGVRVVAEGLSFMTHKVGGDKDDTEIGAWWAAMKPFRGQLLLGAYWVLYPGDPVGRADAFLARLDAQCPGWRDGPFILQADCEEWNQDPATKPGKADIKAFCDRLKAKCPKLMPIVYASRGQYGDSLTGLGYPLWNARYSLSYQAGTATALYAAALNAGSGWGSYSGQVPAIWQFTSSATIAGQTTCDANAYRGTLAQLTALLAPGWDDDMPTVQDFLNGLYNDLKDDTTGISQQLDRHLDKAVARALDTARPYTGAPGARIAGRGWNPLSPWVLLEYVAESLFASGDRQLPDGTSGGSGTVQARLDRIENSADTLIAGEEAPS